MRNRLLPPLLVTQFLIALQVALTFWSEVGGQYHLDLMFWPWKFGLSIIAALLITGITADLARRPGSPTRRAKILFSLLIVIIVVAGAVTYYYHLNEPADDQQDTGDQPAQITGLTFHRENGILPVRR